MVVVPALFVAALAVTPAPAQAQHLEGPVVTSSPASGSTYNPGEIIVVQVRPRSVPNTNGWVSITSGPSPNNLRLGLNVGGSVKSLAGSVQRRQFSYSFYDSDIRQQVTRTRNTNVLEFRYTVVKGDRDTNGVSVATNALTGGNIGATVGGTSFGGGTHNPNISKNHRAMTDQSGHKVDTPAPSFSGVSGPSVTFYTGGSVNYRLPTISNADEAHNVSYSITPSLPTGYSLNTSTATITGSHSSASSRRNYTLRATDGFSRRADLTFSLAVSTDKGIESITITSNPGTDKTYGKTADFGPNDNITVTVDFTHRLSVVIWRNTCLSIRIGANTRSQCNPTTYLTDGNRWDKIYFSYAVQATDWDGDGISFPQNPLGSGKSGNLRFHATGQGADNRVTRDFGITLDDPNHKVRGQQTTPTFGSTSSPSYTWVKDNAVSQQLPAAMQGDGGVTYSIEGRLPAGLTFAAGTRTISGTPTSTQGRTNYTLVATDADRERATLRFSIQVQDLLFSVSSPTVAEGAAGETAALDYDVTLNRTPGRQVTVAYAADTNPGTASSGTDYTAFAGGTLTFASTETSKTITVTVTGDALDEPNETIRIALSNPDGAVLGSASVGTGTITDDDPTPTLALALSDPDPVRPDTIAESGTGNATTVTATLTGGTSGEAITVTVGVASVYAALAPDGGYSVSAARTLIIAAGATASTGTVTITATDDAIDSRDKSATVSGTVAGGHGLVAAPADLTLTIADDDAQPRSALALSPASISESGGVATVTATLSNPSAAGVTLTVSATAVSPAVDGDFILSPSATLTVAAGQTTSTGTVTVTAVGNAIDAPDKQVTVSGTASGTPGAVDPPDATLTIRDDDDPPTVALALSSTSITESSGVTTVTATLSDASSEAVMVTVAAAPEPGASVGDYTLTGTTLTIAANATTSTGTVTITAVNNHLREGDKQVRVSGRVTGGGLADPSDRLLTITDNEPSVSATTWRNVDPSANTWDITTASLLAKTAAQTLMVTPNPSSQSVTDFWACATRTVAQSTQSYTSTGPDTRICTRLTDNSTPNSITLTQAMIDNDGVVIVLVQEASGNQYLYLYAEWVPIVALPKATLALSSSSISENGGVATVTATLDKPASGAATVTVAASPGAGTDFTLSGRTALAFADGATASTGTVTITAVDDGTDAPNASVTISGTVSGDVSPPDATTLTLIDDEGPPMVTLALKPTSILEGSVATVTASLSGTSGAAVTVTVQMAPGTRAASQTGATLTIAAGATASTGLVTIMAFNNDMRTGNRQVTVSGRAAGGGVADPAGVTLTITDNDGTLPTGSDRRWVTSLGASYDVTTTSLEGKTAPQTITVTGNSLGARWVWACAYRTVKQFTGSRGPAPTEGAACSRTTGTGGSRTISLTQAMIDNDGVVVLITHGGLFPDNRTTYYYYGEWLPIMQLPRATLALSSSSISENGGVATVTATLNKSALSAAVLTVTVAPGAGAAARDFTQTGTTLTFASGATASTGTVTVTGVDNAAYSPIKTVTVSGTGTDDVHAPAATTLTVTDDEALPTVALALSSTSISETGGVATVTATLSGASTEAVMVTVGASAGARAAAADFDLSAAKTLTIAAGDVASTGEVTITANGNDVHSLDKSVTVSGMVTGGHGVAAPSTATLTLTDDETLPTVALALSSASISESGGVATVTATLSGKSSEAVMVTVAAAAGTGAVAADFDLSTAATLTISAGVTASAGLVTVTANDNDVDAADKQVTISAGLAGGNGAADPTDETLTITDNDVAGLTVEESSGSTTVTEATGTGRTDTFTVKLDSAPTAEVVVTVSSGDLSEGTVSPTVLRFGATAGTRREGASLLRTYKWDDARTVTVTGVDDDVDDGTQTWDVTVNPDSAAGAAGDANYRDVVTDSTVSVSTTDDDTAGLTLSKTMVATSEAGTADTFTVTLSSEPTAQVSVAISDGGSDEVTVSPTVLTFGSGNWNTAQTVTVTPEDDAVSDGIQSYQITLDPDSAADPGGDALYRALDSATVTGTNADNDAPLVMLALSSTSITESGGVATVTATLMGDSSGAVTVTVGAAAGTGATNADFDLSTARTLTIAVGQTTSTGTVTVTANGNDVDSPDKQVTISGVVTSSNNVAAPMDVTLTLTDDEALPTVALALSSTSITESGGETTVTATLSGKSSEAVTVTVGAAAGTGAAAADFTLSTAKTLMIAAGQTAGAGTVTVTANGNDVDTLDKQVTVSATVAGGNGVVAPSNLTLTLTDDDTAGVTFNPTTMTLTEEGAGKKVTLVLDTEPPPVPGEVWVGIYPDAGLRLENDPLRVFPNGLNFSFTASSWRTPKTVTVDALADGDHQDNTLRLRYVVANYGLGDVGQGVAHAQRPVAVTVTVVDDDKPQVTLALSESSISENGEVATVTAALNRTASEATTVTVSASPGAGTDFTQMGTALTIAAGDTSSTGVVTITASDNATDAPDKTVTVSAMVEGGDGASAPSDVTLTITDDEAAPGVTLTLSANSIAENGGEATVTAALAHPSSEATEVTVTAVSGFYTAGSDATIMIAAGDVANAADVAMITAVDDDVYQGSGGRSTTVTATVMNDHGAGSVTGAPLTLTDDETLPTVALALSSSSITESGGETTVTATLSGKSSEAVTVTVGAAPGTGAVAADFDLSTARTLTIAAGATTSTGTVTVTANGNDVDSPDKEVTVSGTVAGGNGVAVPSNLTLTLTDDETLPTVALALSSASITESGGETTVTATLSGKSSEAVTVTVLGALGMGAEAGDFVLSAAQTLTIAAGTTTSTGTVTVTANDNDVDSPDKSVRVVGTVEGGNGVAAPADVTLTLTDDETLPTVALGLSPPSITESGGVSAVTATLSGKSSEAVTVTVGAVAGTGAVGADFDLSTARTLTIAAGATTSTGTVTVTANGNDVDSPDKEVTVSGTVEGGNGVAVPADVTLTLTDDETLPTVALALSPPSITENGGISTVTATLSGKSSEAVTVTVGAAAGTGAVGADFDLSTARTLTIAAGQTTSTGAVTVTANDNTVDAPDKTVTVSGTVTGGNGVALPTAVTLTLTNDDMAAVTLLLSDPISGQPDTIKELATAPSGERMTTVTAQLNVPLSEALTITVSATSGTNAAADDFTLSAATTLTIAAGATTSSGTVTITAADDRIDSIVDTTVAGKKVVVKGAVASGTVAPEGPADVELLIWEDDRAALVTDPAFPRCRRAPCPAWISVDEGASETFTVKLNSEPTTTIRVAVKSSESDEGLVSSGSSAAADSTTLTFTAATWETAQTVTLTGVIDNVVDGDDDYTLRIFPDTPDEATDAYHVIGGASVRPQTVMTTDVDVAGLTVSESTLTVTEGGAEQTFTVKLTSRPTAAVTVTVSSANGGEVQVAKSAGDANERAFAGSKTLTFMGSNWDQTQTVRVNAVDDVQDDPATFEIGLTLDISGGDSNYNGLDDESVTVTKTDDDPTPTVTLVLSSPSITENGGVSTVTATLSSQSGEAATVTVAAAAGTGAVGADFDLSTAKTLTIPAGSTTSTGTVTVTANDNAVDSPDKSVTVSGTVTGGHGLLSLPSNVTLTLTDDDALPTVSLGLSPASITEESGVSTVTASLSGASSEAVTVTVAAAAGTGAVGADFNLSMAKALTIPAGSTTSTGLVTVTANGNTVDSPDKSVTVSGTVTGGNGVTVPSNVTLTLTDNEALPTVTLALSPTSISEENEVSTVTAALSGTSSEAVVVTVAAAAGTGAVAADFDLSTARTLTIAAGQMTSTGTVTVTANGNTVDSPNKSVTVSGTATGGNSVANPTDVTLTLTDDEALPTVTLGLSPTSISEENEVSTVTAALSGASSEAVVVTVGAAAGTGAVAADFTLSGTMLTIDAGQTGSTGQVTVTANGNTVDSPNKSVTVSGTVTGGNGVAVPSDVTLTLTDDDMLPTMTLVLSATTIKESGNPNVTTVTARLNHGSSEAVTVTVTVTPDITTGAATSDYTLSSTNTLMIAASSTTSTGLVTVTAVDNSADEPHIEVTVSGTAAGGGNVSDPTSKTLTIRDDEGPPTVTLALAPGTIDEGGTATTVTTVTASLNRASSAATTVTVSAAPGTNAVAGHYTLSATNTLEIAAGATTSTGLVTVTAVDDNTDAPNRMVTISGMASNSQGVMNPLDMTLTIRDDDAAPDATLSVVSSSISEDGGSTMVSATLSRPSSEPTMVTVTAVANVYTVGADATIAIAAGQTANTADSATINAVNNDVDAANTMTTVTGTMANTQGTGTVTGAALTITDDDTAGFTVSPTTSTSSRLTTTEAGGTATFTVKLDSEPTGNVVLGVASADTTEGRVSPSSLTFTTSDWNTEQTVTLTGQDDPDADGNVNYTVTLTVNQSSTADSNYDVVSMQTIYALNVDDEYGLALAGETGLMVTEAGTTATFTVALMTAPSANVMVAVSSGDTSEGRVSPSSLTFTTSNWNTERTVTVTGNNDSIDDGDVAWDVRLDPSSTGDGNYNALANVDVSVTTTDDDGAPGVTLGLMPTSISENGGTAMVRATLSHGSGAATTVTVTAGTGYTVGTGAAGIILIPAGQTSNSSDTATVNAVDDAIHQGSVGRSTTVTATVANARATADGTTMTVTGATLMLTDDEMAPGATLALSDNSIAENGGTSVVSATLSGASAVPTTVTVTPEDGFYTVGPDAIIAIPAEATANAADTVTITAVDNATDEPNRMTTVTGTLANAVGAGSVTGATLTLEDNDAAPTVTLSVASSSISENGGTTMVSATLSHPSSAVTTVTVTGGGTAYTVASGTGATIVIAEGSTASTDRATITADDNAVDAAPNMVTVTGTAQNTQGVGTVTGAALTITDDDTAAIVRSAGATETARVRTSEDGSTAEVEVTLATQPTGDVVMNVASSDAAQGTVLPASLTFTATTWNTAQPVTLTGVDDDPDLPDGSQTYHVTLTVDIGNTADANYNGLAAVSIYAINADDELGLDVGPVMGQATEAGGTATFTVKLVTDPGEATAPSQTVTVSVSSLDPGEGTVSPTSLTFTAGASGNWNTFQTVTVTGVDDAIDDGTVTWQVRLDPSSASGSDYDNLASEDVSVTTDDDDTASLVLSPATTTTSRLQMPEGGTVNITVKLGSEPTADVVVIFSSGTVDEPERVPGATFPDTDLRDGSPYRTFTPQNWNTPQTVTMTAMDDDVFDGDQNFSIDANVHDATTDDTNYHGVGTTTIHATNVDDDTPGLEIVPTAVTLREQPPDSLPDMEPYTVRLDTKPTAAVMVTVTVTAESPNNPNAVSVLPTALTFDASTWNVAQPVTVTTDEDEVDSYRDEEVRVTHTAASSDNSYHDLSADLQVTVEDDDTPPELSATGDDTTTINGHPVTVTAPEGEATPDVTVIPPSGLEGDLVVATRPVAEAPPDVTAIDETEGTGPVRQRFSLGTEAAERTVVDIEVTGAGLATVRTAGITICLPVTPELRTEAMGRPLELLHYKDGEWTVVPEPDDQDDRVCAIVTDFSPFALGYRDLEPAFAPDAQQLPPRTYLTGRAVNDTLPGATGGDGQRTYKLTPAEDLPDGLAYKEPEAGASHGGTITGTPTTPMAPQDYTLTVEDEDGDSASITISIEVKPGIESRDLGLVLAGIGRTLATDAVEVLGGRFGSAPASRLQVTLGGQVLRLTQPASAPSPTPPPSPLEGEGRGEGSLLRGEGKVLQGESSLLQGEAPRASNGPSPWQRATGLAIGVARALGVTLNLPSSGNSPSPLAGEGQGEGSLLQGAGSILQSDVRLPGRVPTDIRRPTPTSNLLRLQPVSGKDLLARSSFELPLTRTGDDGVPAWTLWGRGSAAGFAGQPEDGFKMDGTLYSGYLGLDYRHASLLMGLAVAHSTGEVSYERTEATKAGADVTLTSVLPYVHWQPYAGLGVWGLLGAGWGEMDLKLDGDPQTRSTRLTSWLGAVGGRQTLTTWQGIDLAAKTDAFMTTVRAAGTAEVPEAQGHAQRVRLLMEGRMAVAVSQASRLEPRLELGGRWDSGTAEQGLGAELGGGVAYTQTEWGLSVDAQGRYLLVHEDGGFEDWGASVSVRLDPGVAGDGVYLTVTPVWGQASSGVDQLWSPTAALTQSGGSSRPAAGWRPGSLEMDVGYGLTLADGWGRLTPYGGLALAGPGASRYRLGSSLALSSSLNVTLEGERAEQPGQKTAHGVSIRLGWQW